MSTTPRKSPRQARAQDTVAAILEAAAHILRDGELAGISTNTIAARAGVSIGSLYQYFPSKEAVLAELLRLKRRRLMERLSAAMSEEAPESLTGLADALIEVALDDQFHDARLALALEYVEASLPLDAETSAFKGALAGRFAAALRTFGVPDAETVASDLVAIGRALIDGAALRGEADVHGLRIRVRRAVLGYLTAGNLAVSAD